MPRKLTPALRCTLEAIAADDPQAAYKSKAALRMQRTLRELGFTIWCQATKTGQCITNAGAEALKS